MILGGLIKSFVKNPLNLKIGEQWHVGTVDGVGGETSHIITMGDEVEPEQDGTRRRMFTSNKLGKGTINERRQTLFDDPSF